MKHWTAVGAALAIVSLQCHAQGKNALGRELQLDSNVPSVGANPPLIKVRKTETPQTKLPPLEARVVVRPQSQITPGLQSVLKPSILLPQRTGLTIEAFTLNRADYVTLQQAVAAPEVVRVEMVRPKKIAPVQRVPYNLDARLSHSVTLFESMHKGQGASVVAAVIDGGSVRKTHVEFQMDRVTVREASVPENAHSTHVAGTMAARGVRPAARGMAPQLKLLSYSFDGDDIAKLSKVAPEIQVSNHSYGPLAGWSIYPVDGQDQWFWFGDTEQSKEEDAEFGKYGTDCERVDGVLLANPHLTSVIAAGNDRNDGPSHQPVEHYVSQFNRDTKALEWVISSDTRKPDGYKSGGLDTLSGLGVCKNTLTVGAINDLYSDGNPIPGAQIESTVFSSWGPTDDGRIKPDVVANGQGLLSATVPGNSGTATPDAVYEDMSGTSMASPTAAGIVAILAEYYRTTHGTRPTAAEMKALLAHTATDAGTKGPDPKFGYGSINALRAGEVIAGTVGETIGMTEVKAQETQTLRMVATGGAVRVSIAWTDPPGRANVGGLNDRTPALMNDIDLEVVGPTNMIFYPYRLDPANPLAPALHDGPNRVDNLEMVDAPAQGGTWFVRIKANALRSGSVQPVALAITGLKRAP
jgi:subtilisin family serine protease